VHYCMCGKASLQETGGSGSRRSSYTGGLAVNQSIHQPIYTTEQVKERRDERASYLIQRASDGPVFRFADCGVDSAPKCLTTVHVWHPRHQSLVPGAWVLPSSCTAQACIDSLYPGPDAAERAFVSRSHCARSSGELTALSVVRAFRQARANLVKFKP
jgi:hypothetical protein